MAKIRSSRGQQLPSFTVRAGGSYCSLTPAHRTHNLPVTKSEVSGAVTGILRVSRRSWSNQLDKHLIARFAPAPERRSRYVTIAGRGRRATSAVRRNGESWLGDCGRDAEAAVLRTQAAVASRQGSRGTCTCTCADTSRAVPGVADPGHSSGQDQTGIAAAPGGPSALFALSLGLEPFRKDDGGAGCEAPAQGPQEVFGPDQAALVDLVLRIPSQELDPGPGAGPVVAPGSSRGGPSRQRAGSRCSGSRQHGRSLPPSLPGPGSPPAFRRARPRRRAGSSTACHRHSRRPGRSAQPR